MKESLVNVFMTGLAKYCPPRISHVVNPRIFQDGKYWEKRTLIKKIYYNFFLFFSLKKNIFKLYMLYYVPGC